MKTLVEVLADSRRWFRHDTAPPRSKGRGHSPHWHANGVTCPIDEADSFTLTGAVHRVAYERDYSVAQRTALRRCLRHALWQLNWSRLPHWDEAFVNDDSRTSHSDIMRACRKADHLADEAGLYDN